MSVLITVSDVRLDLTFSLYKLWCPGKITKPTFWATVLAYKVAQSGFMKIDMHVISIFKKNKKQNNSVSFQQIPLNVTHSAFNVKK